MIKRIVTLLIVAALCVAAPGPMDAAKKQKAKAKVALTKQNSQKAKSKSKPVTAESKKKDFIVISKKDLNLRVYSPQGGDTVLLAQFPVCLSKNKGNKQRVGDMKTPESPAGKPPWQYPGLWALVPATTHAGPFGYRHPRQHQQREQCARSGQ